jgi:hypothetical protein
MTRTVVPYAAPDLSALARLLERALADHQVTRGGLPGHVEMMNLLARGAGHRNLQALQAATSRSPAAAPSAPADSATDAWFHAPPIDAPVDSAAAGLPVLSPHARKALEHFDAAGRLERWPLKLSVQSVALWVLWTRFDARRVYTEAQVNQVLKAWHLYGDHATLRRELVNHKLLTRKSDCSEYRKVQLEPDDEARALLQALRSPARRVATRRSNRPPRVLPKVAAATVFDGGAK